jgi:sulfide:quinone oxidoreductase
MQTRIVILGCGTGGTLAANRLDRAYGDSAQITVADRDDRHVYQPGLLQVPFGADPEGIVRSRHAQLRDGVAFRLADVDRVVTAEDRVYLNTGDHLSYDVLVIATGASLLPEETVGLTGAGWGERMFTFYSLEGARGLQAALRQFESGRLVVNLIDLPIKCPVAPLEFCFLADWHLRQRGVRQDVELVYVTPLDGAFTKPVASERLAHLLAEKEIVVESEFAVGEIDGARGKLHSWDERELTFDLLVTVPLHGGAEFVGRSSGLGDDLGFVATDKRTLQSKAAANVFAIGDAADIPTSKAGSVTHFEGETLVKNIHRLLAGEPLEESFDGHTNCFIQTGHHKALLIDFNYKQEPLPGRFPEPRLGPLPLLQESRLNHLAKLAMEPIYWHLLLPGHPLPGISDQMHASAAVTSTIAT